MNYSDLDIVYLTTKGIPDYLHDALFKGFTDLGCNVVDFPEKTSLHGHWSYDDFRVEQLLFNYPKKDLRKSPIDILIVTGMLHNFNSCRSHEGWTKFVQEVIDKLQPDKIVMIDGEDFTQCSYPILTRNFDQIFKREIFQKPYENWHSINFAAVPESFQYIPYADRKIDVSFIATLSNHYRTEVKNFLLEKTAELGMTAFVHMERTPLDRKEFLKIVSQSKACVSVRGMGWDCYRYWELPAKGTVMITEDTGLLVENDFTDQHVFKFKNFDELGQILIQIKEGPIEKLETMALQSLLFTQQFHTPKLRAEYVLRKVFNNVP